MVKKDPAKSGVGKPQELLFQVEVTDNFFARLDAIGVFLTEADAAAIFDKLLAGLRDQVVPNLRRFPRMCRLYLDDPPQSAEALMLLAALPASTVATLRECLHGDYLILYTVPDTRATAYLLSIRHHRQLAFKFGQS